MQCEIEERMIRRQEIVVVECFKCGGEGHKCRQCLLWEKRDRVAHPTEGKAHQRGERKLVCLERGKVQECSEKREVRRAEEEEAVMGDQREFDLETRVITNGNNKSPRCFTVVH